MYNADQDLHLPDFGVVYDGCTHLTVRVCFLCVYITVMCGCMRVCVDMVKVRLQLGATGSPLAIAGRIISEEGVGALYKGLSAGLVRQATYTTARYVVVVF